MRMSLEEYTIGEIEKMRDIVGNANYDTYDKIMNHICWEFDDIMNQDALLKDDRQVMSLLKQLNFFVSSFVSNKKMQLTEREQDRLRELILTIDKEVLRRPEIQTLRTYNKAYRKCMLEFLSRSAHFKLNKPTINVVR